MKIVLILVFWWSEDIFRAIDCWNSGNRGYWRVANIVIVDPVRLYFGLEGLEREFLLKKEFFLVNNFLLILEVFCLVLIFEVLKVHELFDKCSVGGLFVVFGLLECLLQWLLLLYQLLVDTLVQLIIQVNPIVFLFAHWLHFVLKPSNKLLELIDSLLVCWTRNSTYSWLCAFLRSLWKRLMALNGLLFDWFAHLYLLAVEDNEWRNWKVLK